MRYIITAGPTYEPLDDVRRMTNASTGTLGTELAAYLRSRDAEAKITLLRGISATCTTKPVEDIRTFTTPVNLLNQFMGLATEEPCAIFHAAAVNDFSLGDVYAEQDDGTLHRLRHSSKYPSRFTRPLFVELFPTIKVIHQLRVLFPNAFIVGWKFETAPQKSKLITKAQRQLRECNTNSCVMNGPAYGDGFGILTSEKEKEFTHLSNKDELFATLQQMAQVALSGR